MQYYIHFYYENCTSTFFTGNASPSQDDCFSTLAATEMGIINALQWSLMFCLSAEGFRILSSHLAAATSLPGALLSVYPSPIKSKVTSSQAFSWIKIATSALATLGRWLPLLSADAIHSSPVSPGEHSLVSNIRLLLNIFNCAFWCTKMLFCMDIYPPYMPKYWKIMYIMKSQISNNYHRF